MASRLGCCRGMIRCYPRRRHAGRATVNTSGGCRSRASRDKSALRFTAPQRKCPVENRAGRAVENAWRVYRTGVTLFSSFPVSSHEFSGPTRLTYLATWRELSHIRLNVQNRRAIDGIQPLNLQRQIFHREQAANGNANAIGPVLATLGKDANLGPVQSTSGMPCANRYLGFLHQMEEKNDLNVRKVSQPREALRNKSRSVQINPAFDAAPDIVDRLRDGTADHTNGAELIPAHHSGYFSRFPSATLPRSSLRVFNRLGKPLPDGRGSVT